MAGAPGYNLPLAALANIFGAQRYATVATGDVATSAGLEHRIHGSRARVGVHRGARALRRARRRR